MPFLVGGSHAFLEYTGIVRNTKDFDLFLRKADMERAMEALRAAGYRAELTFPHWLGKAWQHDDFVDLVFSSGNGLAVVDDGWFEHAVETQVLGMPVKIVPCEEFIWQKSFVMERERFDGADIMHMLRAQGAQLDWARLSDRYARPVAAAVQLSRHVRVRVSERDRRAPRAAARRFRPSGSRRCARAEHTDKVCRGTLVSRAQYLIDIGQYGYADARLAPRGTMSPEDAIFWTWAIDHVK